MTRRDVLKLMLISSVLPALSKASNELRIGLALGSGGAKGLAHLLMLEVFDELGVVPHRIAGSSIGAVMGTLYASGMSGMEIRKVIDKLTVSNGESLFDSLFTEEITRWFDFVELRLGEGGLADSSVFISYLGEITGCSNFSELKIPLKVVCTDFWSREQVVFDSGPLLPAVQASMAMPGLFEPVRHMGRVLVDGGLVNPVPFDLLRNGCDLVVAIDVLGVRTPEGDTGPGIFENSFNSFQIMQSAIVREKMARQAPDIYIRPEIEDIRVLEFYKVDQIFLQAESAAHQLRLMLIDKLKR